LERSFGTFLLELYIISMAGGGASGDDYVVGVPYPYYVLVPVEPRRPRIRRFCVVWSAFRIFVVALLLVSSAILGYMLFPREPDVEVQKITLEAINLHVVDNKSIIPTVLLDVSLSLRLKITNSNFFGVLYEKLVIVFSYRGDDLGTMASAGGKIHSRSVAMATARLDLLGAPLLNHSAELIEDVARRKVSLQTVTEFDGAAEMFTLRPRLKVIVVSFALIFCGYQCSLQW
jgi:hypothetical protein